MLASMALQAMAPRRPTACAACRRFASASLSTALLAACATGDLPRAGVADYDTESLARLELHTTLRIGSVDDPDVGFSRIAGVDVDGNGLIYVFESQDRQIRVYGRDGHLLRTIGGRGQGPGEFASPAAAFAVVGDTIWSFEQSSGRLNLFAGDGRVLAAHRWNIVQVPTQLRGQTRSIVPYFMRQDGRFIGGTGGTRGGGAGPGTPSQDTLWLPRLLFDATGAVLDTLGWEALPPPDRAEPDIVEIGSSQYLRPAAPTAYSRSALLPDGRAVVDQTIATDAATAVFRVTRLGFAGDTLVSRTFSYSPSAYPAAVLDTAVVRAVRPTSGPMLVMTPSGVITLGRRLPQDSAAAHRALRASLAFPPFQPPVSAFRHTADGGFWVRRDDDGGPTFRWIVLDAELQPLGQVEIPRALRIQWSHRRNVIGVENDELGIPWLVQYELRAVGM